MEKALRKEVREFLRVCEQFLDDAHQNNGRLSLEECELMMVYVREFRLKNFPAPNTTHFGLGA
jgi:hypothetical protein